METAVEIQNLSFIYKDQNQGKALDGIDLTIQTGEFVMVLGPSGAGKSTLAHCLNGIIPAMVRGRYEGSVTVNGKEISKHTVSHLAKDIGLVFQDFENQLFSTNVRLEIAFSSENFSVPREEMDSIIDEMLTLIGLTGFDKREPSTLSGGQKQRLVIGSVLAGRPKVLCMDEPTTDLDPLGKIGVFKLAGKLKASGGITLVIIEHETSEALYADRVLVMKNGRIHTLGKAADVLRNIKAFNDCGIMPLQVPDFFFRYKGEKPDVLPLTPEEGFEAFKRHNIVISDTKHKELCAKDAEHEKSYGEVLIDINDVSFTYPSGTTALHSTNLKVREGEFLAIVGHNGSGKTTLVKHFNGILKPSLGTVTVCGKDTAKHTIFEIGRDVGFVFQNPDHQIFSETIYDEVVFSPKLRGVPEAELPDRVKEALRAVELDGCEKDDPFTMSKGIRQRIAVASVLSAHPRVIILDEPTTGLDYSEQRKMMALVKRLNENGHTVIIITHTMWVVAEYAHRVAVMNGGKIIMYGSTRDVFANEAELRTHSLLTPHIVALSNYAGKTVLSLDEMLYCTEHQ